MKKSIYLAGPITGLSYDTVTDWRQHVINTFPEYDCYSPMRMAESLKDETSIADEYPDSFLSNQRAVLARNFNDCKNCDLVMVNLLGAKKVSIGTVMEISFAYALGTPIMLIMEKENNLHNHCMIREACPFVTDDLELALQGIRSILSPLTNTSV